MTFTNRLIGYSVAVGFAVAVGAASGNAQTVANKAVAEAVALENSAAAWLGTPEKWPTLAKNLERAAKLRGADDPRAVEDLLFSATVRLQLGQATRAQTQFVQAADWALAIGDVESAATGYVRAAIVAAQLKDAAGAQELRDKAVRLARSPLLNEDQRASILNHFAGL